MRHAIASLVVLLFAVSLPATAEAPMPTPVSGVILDAVAAIDANHNGGLDRAEWKKAGQDTFLAVDSDKDGSISGLEFAVLHGAMFAAIDLDRDTLLSPEEIDAYKRLPWTLRASR
jgi:hypothetical protein